MCGIIGYVGPREACPILLGGLSRLEYRGYDSAGIATLTPSGHMEIRRAVGKLGNPRHLLDESPLTGCIGIGHTRWATHGRPSEGNAHPHKAGPVAVIHNGIIENYLELRTALLQRNHKLRSETDTELISHLIEEQLKGTPGLNYDAAKGPVTAPWLSWGPYLWANGAIKRSDGFSYEESDFGGDGTHPSVSGVRKVAHLLLDFFKNDSTAKGWFTVPN